MVVVITVVAATTIASVDLFKIFGLHPAQCPKAVFAFSQDFLKCSFSVLSSSGMELFLPCAVMCL